MSRRDRSLRHLFLKPQVPAHRPGFWDSLERELENVSATNEAGGDELEPGVVALDRREGRSRRLSPWLVASAAAAVVLVLGAATAVFLRPAAGGDAATTAGVTVAVTPAGASPTTLGVAETAPRDDPPWSAARLRRGEVPAVLAAEWQAAENQLWCGALAPSNLGVAGEATPRAAESAGGWAVAWDRPDGAGQHADGTDCEDCGRSAFGIAGTGLPHDSRTVVLQPANVEWSDGSAGGWDPTATTVKRLAEVVVGGQGCTYHVWSNLGEAHLLRLIDGLRLVQGLEAEPVVLRRPGDPASVVHLGTPPWDSSVPESAVDVLVREQLETLDVAAPRVVLADLGDEVGVAEIRTWDSGVAWDADDGPGHDADNQPCADCGRGVVGLGWVDSAVAEAGEVTPAHRVEWSDGSYADYGGRRSPHAVPRDRIIFFDAESSERTVDALRAVVVIQGVDRNVEVWTHLGESHLLYLLGRLRVLES